MLRPRPLIIDNGLYTGFAERLARDQEIAYFSAWHNAAPTSRELAPAMGLPNIERVNHPLDYIAEGRASAIYVPDINLTDYEHLARKLNLPVFGAGDGNQLETNRWALKEFLARHDLDVITSVEIEGIDNLEAYLRDPRNGDKYIKVSMVRGDFETFHHEDWSGTADWFTELRGRIGPLGAHLRFIVEDPIEDAYEVGIDGFFVDGTLLEPFVIGPEIKDAGYVGVLCEHVKELPQRVRAVIKALAQYFAETNYRCWFSNEMRVTPNGTVYMTDATCRMPSPPGGVIMNAMRNFSEVVAAIAEGERPAPDFGDARYFCEYVLKSDWAAKHFLELRYPAEFAAQLAFHNHCRIDGRNWIIPHSWGQIEIGSAVGWGTTLKDATTMAAASAKAVKAYPDGVQYARDALDLAARELSRGGRLDFPV